MYYTANKPTLHKIKLLGAQVKGCNDFIGLIFCPMSGLIMGPFHHPILPIIGVHSSGVAQAHILISRVFQVVILTDQMEVLPACFLAINSNETGNVTI